MDLKEFIEKEKKTNKKTGYVLEEMLKDLINSDKYTFTMHEYQIIGFLSALKYTDYISKEIELELYRNAINIADKKYNEIFNLQKTKG